MRRKEWAASQGLCNDGRGRMPRAALEAIEKARAEGMVFDDDDVAPKSPKTVTMQSGRTTNVRPVSKPVNAQSVGDFILLHDLDKTFTGEDGGKKITVNARQVCRNTGYSIAGCSCGGVHSVLSPRSLTHINVS